jgi:hypothetical protein
MRALLSQYGELNRQLALPPVRCAPLIHIVGNSSTAICKVLLLSHRSWHFPVPIRGPFWQSSFLLGARAWKRPRPLMAMAGHELFGPTYTGLGERAHLASTENDLGSIAAAEARRGEISAHKVAAVRRAMAQARMMTRQPVSAFASLKKGRNDKIHTHVSRINIHCKWIYPSPTMPISGPAGGHEPTASPRM